MEKRERMAGPLIELRDVDVALNGRTILRGLTWSLQPGEHWSVTGANGSGKSTFLRLLRAEVCPVPGKGRRIYQLDGGRQVSAVGVRQQIALVSPESQQRYLQQEWQLSARDVIRTGFAQTDLLYTPLDPKQRRAADELAERLHLGPLLRRDMQTLSTGELRKVLIARALVGHPRILLLDEVCDGLDASFRREMLAFIDSIARHGTQVIYTTHRADEAVPAITHELVLEQGRVRAVSKLKPQTTSARAQGPKPRSGAPRSAPGPSTRAGTRERASRPSLVSIRQASVYLGRTRVLRDIDWELRAGEHWVVLGGNGAGKTTFLRLVASELYPAVGAAVERFGLTRANTIWDLRRRIGTVSPLLQTHYRESITAAQVVGSGFHSSFGLMDELTGAQRRRVRSLLEEFGLAALAAKPMSELSFGELRKTLMLRALVHQPKLLIFDEPFDGLDDCARAEFAGALDSVASAGTHLAIVTHHLDDLPRCINRALFLEKGRVAFAEAWPAMREHPKLVALFGRAGGS